MNHFDEFFEQHVKPRTDLELKDVRREPFPLAPCLWILKASNVILDNCANRHVYASSEHLASLLAHEDDDVALGALGVLASATRRPPGTRSSNRFRADTKMRARLAALCAGLHDGAGKGGDDDGAKESSRRGASGQSAASSATVFGVKIGEHDLESGNACDVHFEFYSEGDGSTRLIAEDVRAGSPMETASALATAHGVPDDLKFTLYARVRLAKLAATMRGASTATQIRLCAFCVLLQSELTGDGGGDEQVLQFVREPSPEFVAELLRILRLEGEGGCPPAVVGLALRVLAALAGDRSHQGGVITAMRAGGQPQVFAALVNSAVQRLTQAPSPPFGKRVGESSLPALEIESINAEADAPVPLAEALVALLGTLVISHGGCQTLRDVSLLPVLLPLLRNRNPRHLHIVSHAVHVLEIFMDYASAAAAAFRELGGLDLVVDRLSQETRDALDEFELTHKERETEEKEKGSVHLVSSQRRVLIKALMRAMALTNFSPGMGNVPAAGLDDGKLCLALNDIFGSTRLFGSGVFSLAANLLCDVMNHEPTSYWKLEKHGTPEAFIAAWEKPKEHAPLPSADALACLPVTLGALSLSAEGLERVKKSKALDALVDAFTTRTYAKLLQGETASTIGGNLDELLRHVPSLQDMGVDLAVDVLRRLVELGGGVVETSDKDDKDPVKKAKTDADSSPGTASDSPKGMDTDSAEKDTSTEPGTEKQFSPSFLMEAVANASHLIDSMLPTDECGQKFVERGGMQLLIQLHTLPLHGASFSSSSQCHALSVTLRALAGQHSKELAKKVQVSLGAAVEKAILAMSHGHEDGFYPPYGPLRDFEWAWIKKNDGVGDAVWETVGHGAPNPLPMDSTAWKAKKVRAALANAEALLNLATTLIRSSPGMLPTLCSGDDSWTSHRSHDANGWVPGLITRISHLQRLVHATAAALQDEGGLRKMEMEERQKKIKEYVVEWCKRTGGQEKDLEKDPNVDSKILMAKQAVEVLQLMQSLQSLSNHFVTSHNYFCSSLAKAASGIKHRHREEYSVQSRGAACELAVQVCCTLETIAGFEFKETEDHRDFRCAQRAFDDVYAILIDSRRRCSQGLVLNYMRQHYKRRADSTATDGSGLDLIAEAFAVVWQQHRRCVEKADAAKAAEKDLKDPVAQMTLETEAEKWKTRADVMEHALKTGIGLIQQLTNVAVLMGSSVSATLLTATLPKFRAPNDVAKRAETYVNGVLGLDGIMTINDAAVFEQSMTEPTASPTAKQFADALHAAMLPALMKVWNSGRIKSCPTQVLVVLMAAMRHLRDGTGRVDAFEGPPRRSRGASGAAARLLGGLAPPPPPPPPPFDPSPTMMASIQEMGFSEPQARAALVAVRGQSIEIAMEWLFTHPEEATAADEAAATAANAATPAPPAETKEEETKEEEITPSQDELAKAMAMSMDEAETADAAAPVSAEPKIELIPQEDLIADGLPATACLRTLLDRDCAMPDAADLIEPMMDICQVNEDMAFPCVTLFKAAVGPAKEPEQKSAMTKILRMVVTAFDAETFSEPDLYTNARFLALLLSDRNGLREIAAAVDDFNVPSSEPSGVQAARAGRVDTNMLVDFTDRVLCALERFLAEHEESGSAVMPKWFSTLVLVIHAVAQWRGVKPMEFDKNSNEWSAKRRMHPIHGLRTNPMDNGKLNAAAERHETNPADALKSVIGSPMGYLDDDACDRATKLCVDVLLLTETQGETVDPSTTIAGALTSDEDVGGVQAALQLLSHLTKDHKRAGVLLKPRNCVNALLNLPRKFAFAAYDALASSILRHVVEDPEVLQAAMATEIHTILGDRGKVNSRRFMPLAMPVISRDPASFVAAMEKCCVITHPSGPGVDPRQSGFIVHLKKKYIDEQIREDGLDPRFDVTPKEKETYLWTPSTRDVPKEGAKETPSKSHGKGHGKKKSHPSFATVLQALIDAVMAYPTDTERSAQAEAVADAPVVDAMDTSLESTGQSGEENSKVNAPSLAAVRASLALRLLTDFTLVYGAAAGQILRMDGQSAAPTEGAAKQTGLLKHVLYVQLPEAKAKLGEADKDGKPAAGGWDGGERAAYLLLALCVRSSEARRRVLHEVSVALKSEDGLKDTKSDKEGPGPARAFVDLVNALLAYAGGKPGGKPEGKDLQRRYAGDLQRCMKDADLLPAMCAALNRVDLNDGAAPVLVNAILRPLEVMTRPVKLEADKDGKPESKVQPRLSQGAGDAGQTAAATTPAAERARTRRQSTEGEPGSAGRLARTATMAAEHDPEQMAQLERVAGQMFESMDRDGDDEEDESGEEESGDEDESGEEESGSDEDSDEDSDGEADIDLMDDHEEQEVAMVEGDGDEEEEEDAAAVDHGHHHGHDDDDEMEASDEDAEDEDEDEDEDEHDEEEGAEINIEDIDGENEDDDDEAGGDDRWDVDDQDDRFDMLFPPFDEHGTNGAGGPPPGGWGPGEIVPLHGHAHGGMAGEEEGDVMHFGGDDDDGMDDEAGLEDGARLAEQLQGLIGNIAEQVNAQNGGQIGGPAPVVELRVRDNRLRELVMRQGGRAVLRPGDVGGLMGAGGAEGGAAAARARGGNLGGGGILSDIFNLRNSLEEARRSNAPAASRRGVANSTAAGIATDAELIYDPTRGAGGVDPLGHPLLGRRPVEFGRATNASGGANAAGMHSVLASISGEMSRLAVGPGGANMGAPAADGRGGFQLIGGNNDGRFLVLPEVSDLGSLLRVERSDGSRGGVDAGGAGAGEDGGRRWDPPRVGDARAATWADPSRGSVAPQHLNPGMDAAASDLEAHLAGILRAEPRPAAQVPAPAAPEPEKPAEGDVEMSAEPEPEPAPVPEPEPTPAPVVEVPAPVVEAPAPVAAEAPPAAAEGDDEDDDEPEADEPEPEEQPIDSEFLNALPADLREELLATNAQIARLNRRSTSADASTAAAAQTLEPIDPSFISALPYDMQAEVVQQQSREVARVMRERAADEARRSAQTAADAAAQAAAAAAAAPEGEGRTEAQRAAAEAATAAAQAAAQAGGAAQGDMDNASVIASFPEELRQEVLLSADESVLATLPEALQAEARTLRERHAAHMQQFRAAPARAAAEAAAADGLEDDDEAGGTAAAAFSRQLRTMLGLTGPGPLGGGRGRGAGWAGGNTAADRAATAAGLTAPVVDRNALLTLVRLLRLAPPPTKGLLPKVLLNLAAHGSTRDIVLRLLLANLRAAMEANEGGAGSLEGGSGSLDVGKLYGRDVHVVCSKPDAAARLLAKRALETAVFLARHSALISRRIPALAVTARDAAEAAAGGALGARSPDDANAIASDDGFTNYPADSPDADAAGGDGAIMLLLRCLGSPAFAPHVGHLELTLQLLDATLKASAFEFELHVKYLREAREKKIAEEKKEEEKTKKAAETNPNPGGGEITAEPETGPGDDTIEGTDARALALSRMTDEALRNIELDRTGMTDEERKKDDEESERLYKELSKDHGSERFAVSRIRESLASDPTRLSALAALLGRDGLTDSVYAKTADVCRAVANVAPAFRGELASALSQQVRSRLGDAVANLESVRYTAAAGQAAQTMATGTAEAASAAAAAAAAKLPPSVASSGSAVLRVSHVVAALLKFDLDAARREETEAAGNAMAAAGAAHDAVIPPARVGPEVDAERDRARRAMGRAIQSFADELNPVWGALSEACTVLEPQIAAAAAVAAASSRGGAAAPALPAGARQILPVIEAYFALAAAINDASKKPAEKAETPKAASEPATAAVHAPLASAPSLDADDRAALGLARVMSPAFGLNRSATPAVGSASVASVPNAAVSELAPVQEESSVSKDGPGGVTSVWNFANEHRSVVNALIRSQPGLIDGSLRLMLEKPRLLDFDNKRSYIRGKLKRLAEREQMRGSHHGPVRAQINRKQVLTDSFMQLQHLKPAELRGRLTIQFSGEEGIDAGGVSREWYMLLARDMFNPDKALFELSPSGDGAYQPFGNSGINETHLAYFKFIGRIIGKAVYDGYLVDAHFTRPFYKHMLNIPLNYDDMEAFDPDYHKSLVYMLEHPLVESGLDYLTMSATTDYFGMETVVDLVPDGRDVAVTDDNKLEYVNLVAAHKMTNAIKEQIAAFTEGFNDIVPHEIISILNPSELELLISGTPEIDIDDLKNNTEYVGYTTSAPQVRWFWEVVKDLSEEDRARLLMFVTGTSKVPLDGFKALQGISGPQRFQIHKAYGGGKRLCSAHTCFNQLDLPEYSTKEELQERLLFAIREGSEGFGFG